MNDRAHRQDAAVAVEADLDLVRDLTRVVGRHEVLAPALDPLHGPPELQGGERHQDVLGVELTAHSEAAAHVDLGEPQRAQRDAEDRREDRPVDVNALGGADQMELAAARIGRHDDETARLQRRRGLPRVGEALTQSQVSPGERLVGVAHAHGDRRDVVRVRGLKEPRGPGGERLGGRGTCGQRLIDDVDPVECVACDVRIVGDDERDGLAHEADDVARDRRLKIAVGALGGGDTIRDDRRRRHVGRGQHGVDAEEVSRALRVDRHQPRVRVRRAKHRGVQHTWHAYVVDESTRARDEPLAAEPGMSFTDHRDILALWPRHGTVWHSERR